MPASQMKDKLCVVTGGTDGIGKEAAYALAVAGAKLLIHGRDPAKGARAVAELQARSGNADIEFLAADFASLTQVRQLAAAIKQRTPRIDVLINNAGGIFMKRGLSQDGYELTFAVNHLAPFLLTHLLRDLLQAAPAARIITTASVAHRGARLDFNDLQSSVKYSPMGAYGRSKLANILFTRELARRLAGTRITATCLHPGLVRTSIARAMPWLARTLFGLMAYLGRSPQKGAETIVYLATLVKLPSANGAYFVDCKVTQPAPGGQDDQVAERLWDISEKLTGVTSVANAALP